MDPIPDELMQIDKRKIARAEGIQQNLNRAPVHTEG